MNGELIEELAEAHVPPVPESFDRDVHLRVNRLLVTVHLLDFVLRATPQVALEFMRATAALARYTLAGDYGGRPGAGQKEE